VREAIDRRREALALLDAKLDYRLFKISVSFPLASP